MSRRRLLSRRGNGGCALVLQSAIACIGLPRGADIRMRRFAAVVPILMCSSALADPCEAPLPHKGQAFSGVVTYIVDGDGFCVGDKDGGIEVRMADFNAIELNQPGGQESKRALKKLIYGKVVSCRAGRRSYDRTVAHCRLDGKSIGDLLRAAGVPEGGN